MNKFVHILCIIMLAVTVLTFLPQATNAQCADAPFIMSVGPLMPDGSSLVLPGSMAIGPDNQMALVTEDGVIRMFKDGVYIRRLPDAYRGTTGIDFDMKGDIYLTGYYNSVSFIHKLTSDGALIMDFVMPSGSVQLNRPFGGRYNKVNDRMYFTDTYNNRVVIFTTDGVFLGQFGSYSCYGLAIAPNGNVYVVENNAIENRIQYFTPTGGLIGQFSSLGTEDWQINHAVNLFVEATDNVLVADKDNNCVKRFSPTGTFICKMGTRGTEDDQFRECRAVCNDANGVIYAADNINARFLVYGTLPTTVKYTTVGYLKSLYAH